MKTLLALLSFFVISSLQAANEYVSFSSLSLSNLTYSIQTNSASATTHDECSAVIGRIKTFMDEVEKVGTNIPPENKLSISNTCFKLSVSMNILSAKTELKRLELRKRMDNGFSDTSLRANYDAEIGLMLLRNRLDLEEEIRGFETSIDRLRKLGVTMTGLLLMLSTSP